MTFDAGPPERPWTPPPRSSLGVRQLVGAILVLLPVILLFGGLSRCSFSPGGPSFDPSAGPSVDAPALLRDLAPQVPFVLRVPAVPPGWRANAVDRAALDGGSAVRVGYLTGAGRYVQLVQSDAAEEIVVRDAAGALPPGRGTVEVAGRVWVVYGGAEPVWVADVDGVRLLVTGSGDDAEFRVLAAAVLAGARLPVGAAPR
ncbi:MAG: DUF4245 domain-containing protein [Pseudonocardia sp.]